ncbi:hypothetical protein LguiA_005181 [Lonicera macranthoides]
MEVGQMKNQQTKASPSSSETASSSRVKILSLKASLVEQQQNTIASSSDENPKTSSLAEQTSSAESSRKNASHVHPKLPGSKRSQSCGNVLVTIEDGVSEVANARKGDRRRGVKDCDQVRRRRRWVRRKSWKRYAKPAAVGFYV